MQELRIEASIELPDDMFARAKVVLATEALLETYRAALGG